MEDNNVIVQVDKTVIKITGLTVKGLNIQELEAIIKDKLKSVVRIIGVTGSSVEMDIYGIEEEAVLKASDGLIKAISLADGLTISDVTKIASVEKIKSVDFDKLPEYQEGTCMKERWLDV